MAVVPDAFAALAEPKRREIIEVLADRGPTPVLALVDEVGLAQPSVSKHLAVLRRAGLVAVTRRGRERIYRLEAGEIKGVYDWTKTFERFWENQLDRIKARAEARAAAAARTARPDPKAKEKES